VKPLRIRPEAANDAREAALWYENERPGLGREFLGVVRDVLGRIETMPLRFPIVLEEIRRALLPRFPFGVFFVVDDDRSTVLAIMHLRRTPTSWDRR
jgi:plasmid stabilization system protein ParE